MRINASDITAWRYCPRSFYYERIEGRKKPLNESLVKGTLVHVIYEEFFKRKLYADTKYFEWFLDKGLERAMEKEDGRINKIGMNRVVLKRFLAASAMRLLKSFNNGEITIPSATEQKIENDEFVAKMDAIFEKNGLPYAVADVKIRLRDLESVKLQLAVAVIILERQGKKVEKGLAIDGETWKEIEVDLTDEVKKEVYDIRDKILRMYETKEKPPCICERCELVV